MSNVRPPAPPPRPVAPPPPPSPPPPRGGLLGLWVGLAALVVLVLGAAVTVVVLQPWEDDPIGMVEGGNGADAPPPTSSVGLPSPTTPPTTSAAPTAPSGPTDPQDDPVTADLDGDGLGDAVAVVGVRGAVTRVLLTSNGKGFTPKAEPLTSYPDSTWADFDGDGGLDQVSWSYRLDGTLVLTSDDLAIGEQDLRLRLDRRQPYATLKAGDFDGDGVADLIAYGAVDPTHVALWVLRNTGGRFGAPQRWGAMGGTTYSLTTVLPADFTGDGIDDVVVRVPVSASRRHQPVRHGFALLASSGSGFVRGPLERPTPFADDADAVVGDFDGDGRPRILLLGGDDGLAAQSLRVRGTRVVRDPRHDVAAGGPGDVVDAMVSDVDGDGADEVVYTAAREGSYDGFRVLGLGRGRPDGRWAATPHCRGGGCTLYFENGY
ncbi:FG-GAP repeat domain-containing protein [Nocardioides sp. MH1]|uniref:FG-GAP repeat domain-containing protein n=1 Tax=Nocardioides sp. MH1 TaxID=3242490 RepID=UPI0035207C20